MSRVRNLIDFNHRVMDMDGNTDDNITVDNITEGGETLILTVNGVSASVSISDSV